MILILTIGSLITSLQINPNIITIKTIGHEPQLDYRIEKYREIKFQQ